MATIVLGSDNFNRANETPLAGGAPNGWTRAGDVADFKLASNSITTQINSNDHSAVAASITLPNNQFSRAKLSTSSSLTNGEGPGLWVRRSNSIKEGYRFCVTHANGEIGRFNGGAFTSLDLFAMPTWTDGDTFELRAEGPVGAVVLTLLKNGAVIRTKTDTAGAGTGLASGFAGVAYSSDIGAGTASIDDWEAGSIVSDGSYRPVIIPNRYVGPMAMREGFRRPQMWLPDLVTYPVPDPKYVPVIIANDRVGPMALRRKFKQPYWPPPFAGTTTQVFFQDLIATATSTSSFQIQVNKNLSATSPSTASIQKQVNKNLSCTSTSTASIQKQANLNLTATATSTATIQALKVILVALTATSSTSATIQLQVNKILSSTATSTATIQKQVNKNLSATSATTATLQALKVIVMALTATATSSATIQKQVNKALSATSTTTSSIQKQVNKILSSTSATTATMQKLISKILIATATSTATLSMIEFVPIPGLNTESQIGTVTVTGGGGAPASVVLWEKLPHIL